MDFLIQVCIHYSVKRRTLLNNTNGNMVGSKPSKLPPDHDSPNTNLSYVIICQIDANFLTADIDQIRAHIAAHNCHIVSIAESWLKPEISDKTVEIFGYYLLRNDRKLCNRGEVACYINNL